MTEENHYYAVNGTEVTIGAKFWNNDLRVCQVTQVAVYSNDYRNGEATQTWHRTTHGDFDTLLGSSPETASYRDIGRLVRWFQGKDAEQYEPGTNYADIK